MSTPRDRILLADDSPVARAVVSRALGRTGAALVQVGSLAEGLAVDAAHLGAAVLDLDLGDGSGLALAEALRAVTPTLPIAFFTDGAANAPAGARALGPVFQKPADLDDVVAWVDALKRA